MASCLRFIPLPPSATFIGLTGGHADSRGKGTTSLSPGAGLISAPGVWFVARMTHLLSSFTISMPMLQQRWLKPSRATAHGISETGGFMPIPYYSTHEINGLYFPDERKLKVPIHGRNVSQQEMTDACAVRLLQSWTRDQPVNNVAYVFAEMESARAHLHELWLRE